MEFLQEVLQYKFLIHAVLASALCGVACGMVGTYVVCRRLVFLSGGITHSSFGGIGIAYYLGLNPLLGAFCFAVLSAIGIEACAADKRIREDSAIGLIWSLGMAVGIIFVYMTPGYAPNLMSFLFGNILMVDSHNLLWLAGLDLFLILLFSLCYRAIVYTAFDREFAASQKLPTGWISHLMMILIAATIVLSIKTMGIVLLMSLLTLPVLIAGTLTRNYKSQTLWACILGALGTFLGLYVSYESNIPSGASAIAVLAITYGVVRIVAACFRRLRQKQAATSRG